MGERKYFLDWLRVFAFLGLIFYHVGMLYVTWGYNLKSTRIYPGLEYAMNAVNPWRLALLFFIAGVASRFLIAKLGSGGFALDRARRLLPVILLGMLVINPIQVYVEILSNGLFRGNYLDFWFGPYMHNAYAPYRITPTWDHLWFLLYLLVYAMGLALLFIGLKRVKHRDIALPWLIVLPGLWLVFSDLLVYEIQPATLAFFNDWANHIRWIGLYASGVICAGQPGFWEALRSGHRRLALATAALLVLHLASLALDFRRWDTAIYAVVAALFGWSVVLTLCGYAAAYLNRSSSALRYLNDAVLPVYVFHQPILLVSAYLIFPLALPVPVEAALLITVTGSGSLAAYEIFARRTRLLRFLFGLKPAPASAPAARAVA